MKRFLSKIQFNYAVVPNKKKYEEDTLHIFAWPTHIIVNRKGLVANVMNDYKEMEVALKKEVLN